MCVFGVCTFLIFVVYFKQPMADRLEKSLCFRPILQEFENTAGCRKRHGKFADSVVQQNSSAKRRVDKIKDFRLILWELKNTAGCWKQNGKFADKVA